MTFKPQCKLFLSNGGEVVLVVEEESGQLTLRSEIAVAVAEGDWTEHTMRLGERGVLPLMFDSIFRCKLNQDGTTYCDLVLRDEILNRRKLRNWHRLRHAGRCLVISYPDHSFFSLEISGVNAGKNYNDVRVTDRTK